MSAVANNNRVTTADWRARMEVTLGGVSDKLDELSAKVGGDLKDHSRRLDIIDLALAQQAHAERERTKLRSDIDSLKLEQRVWTGIATSLAALASVLGFRK